ncbi:hypothetical protein AHAS_Ahas18G0176100 [Arachis hypogaea]
MSTKVPFDLTWVDINVVTPVLIIDREYAKQFRRHHRLCVNREDERNYEIIVADPKEKVCFFQLDRSERPFFYAYDCFSTELDVHLPFSDFEIDV